MMIIISNQENINIFGGEKKYKYMGLLEADTVKQTKMKEKNKNVDYSDYSTS